MILHAKYAAVSDADVRDFIADQRLARLVTSSPEHGPHLGLYPFVFNGDALEVHLRKDDEQVRDLRVNASCIFEVDEPLATIPSDWEHPENAAMADQYYRFASFDCDVLIHDDAAAVAAHLRRVLERYQPGVVHAPVNADSPMYGGMIRQLALLEMRPRSKRIKFKIGQQRPPAVRSAIVERLRARGTPLDMKTADIVENSATSS